MVDLTKSTRANKNWGDDGVNARPLAGENFLVDYTPGATNIAGWKISIFKEGNIYIDSIRVHFPASELLVYWRVINQDFIKEPLKADSSESAPEVLIAEACAATGETTYTRS